MYITSSLNREVTSLGNKLKRERISGGWRLEDAGARGRTQQVISGERGAAGFELALSRVSPTADS